jgi:hypothetical protein
MTMMMHWGIETCRSIYIQFSIKYTVRLFSCLYRTSLYIFTFIPTNAHYNNVNINLITESTKIKKYSLKMDTFVRNM